MTEEVTASALKNPLKEKKTEGVRFADDVGGKKEELRALLSLQEAKKQPPTDSEDGNTKSVTEETSQNRTTPIDSRTTPDNLVGDELGKEKANPMMVPGPEPYVNQGRKETRVPGPEPEPPYRTRKKPSIPEDTSGPYYE